MRVKGSRPACVEVGDAACERPSVCFHRPAAGGLILSHPDVIDAELQPEGTSQRVVSVVASDIQHRPTKE